MSNRVLVRCDVTCSDSSIEADWRSFKHQWLFTDSLDTIEALSGLIVFRVEQHDFVIPDSAVNGLKPDDLWCGTGTNLAAQLHSARTAARRDGLTVNRTVACSTCEATVRVMSPRVQFRSPDS